MKKAFTLTRTLSLVALVLVFAGASAANIKDDTSKCKKHCCKEKQASKEVKEAMAIATASLESMLGELKSFDVIKFKAEINEALATSNFQFAGRTIFMFDLPEKEASLAETTGFQAMNKEMDKLQEDMSKAPAAADQKIDFNNISKEMNATQENMTQMDASLKYVEAKSQKKAESILKTGIKY